MTLRVDHPPGRDRNAQDMPMPASITELFKSTSQYCQWVLTSTATLSRRDRDIASEYACKICSAWSCKLSSSKMPPISTNTAPCVYRGMNSENNAGSHQILNIAEYMILRSLPVVQPPLISVLCVRTSGTSNRKRTRLNPSHKCAYRLP